MTFDDCIFILLEIAWEGGIADDIRTAVVIADVFQMCSSFHDEPFSYLKRNQACILTDDEEMKQVIFSGSFFDKVLMTEGERIGVHDKGSNFFWWICISICCSLV